MKPLLTLALLTLAIPALAGEYIIHVPGDVPNIQKALELAQTIDTGVEIIIAPGVYYESNLVLDSAEYTVKLKGYDAVLDCEGGFGLAVYNSHFYLDGLTFRDTDVALGIFDGTTLYMRDTNFVHCNAGPERGILTFYGSTIYADGHFEEVENAENTICILEEGSTGYFFFVNTPGPRCQVIVDGIDVGATPVLALSWGQIKAEYRWQGLTSSYNWYGRIMGEW